MGNNNFTKAELNDLFGGAKSRSPNTAPDHKRHQINKVIEPLLLIETDPKYKPTIREKTIKYLTIKKPRRILRRTINRKDDKMAVKTKIQTNHTQNAAICLLAGGAVLGTADLLGGGLRACFVAALLVIAIAGYAIDYRK